MKSRSRLGLSSSSHAASIADFALARFSGRRTSPAERPDNGGGDSDSECAETTRRRGWKRRPLTFPRAIHLRWRWTILTSLIPPIRTCIQSVMQSSHC